MEDVKVVSIKPIGPVADPGLQQTMQDTAQAMDEALKGLSGSQNEKEVKAVSFLNKLQDYIKGDTFKSDVEETAKKYGMPPKQVAQNFFAKALGTVGDILGVAISAVCNAGHMVINIASTIAHGIVNLIHSIASGLASIVTLNKTCVA